MSNVGEEAERKRETSPDLRKNRYLRWLASAPFTQRPWQRGSTTLLGRHRFFLPGADFEIKMDCAMALALRFSVAEANGGRYVRGGREVCD